MVGVGRGLKEHLVLIPCHGQGHQKNCRELGAYQQGQKPVSVMGQFFSAAFKSS